MESEHSFLTKTQQFAEYFYQPERLRGCSQLDEWTTGVDIGQQE